MVVVVVVAGRGVVMHGMDVGASLAMFRRSNRLLQPARSAKKKNGMGFNAGRARAGFTVQRGDVRGNERTSIGWLCCSRGKRAWARNSSIDRVDLLFWPSPSRHSQSHPPPTVAPCRRAETVSLYLPHTTDHATAIFQTLWSNPTCPRPYPFDIHCCTLA